MFSNVTTCIFRNSTTCIFSNVTVSFVQHKLPHTNTLPHITCLLPWFPSSVTCRSRRSGLDSMFAAADDFADVLEGNADAASAAVGTLDDVRNTDKASEYSSFTRSPLYS